MATGKKRKIVMAIICSIVILIGIVMSILLITQKKYDLTPNNTIEYNNHTKLVVTGPGTNYKITNNSNPTYYSNGTVQIEDSQSGTFGIYSFLSNSIIIPAKYTNENITPIALKCNNENTGEHIFRVGSKVGELDNKISFVNDQGTPLNITSYDNDTYVNYGEIKEKKLDIASKRKGVKVSTKNKFSTKKIELLNAEYIESYIGKNYHYETWKLTDKNGAEYVNLYEVKNKQRNLLQTINIELGNSANLMENIKLNILSDGTPRLMSYNYQEVSDTETIAEITIYTINYRKKDTAKITLNEHLSTYFQVGDYMYFQYTTPATEKDHDYYDVIDGETKYYNVSTHKLNLKNGNYTDIKCKYLITNADTSFNPNTALLTIRKIKNKTLSDSQLMIANETLKMKEVNYTIDSITKITKDRYLVENEKGQYLIDDDYNEICYLGDYNSFFTTKESIILTDDNSNFTYIVTLDGVVIKKYPSKQIINVYDDTYYIVKTEKVENNVTITEKYLERLGIREKTPIYSQANETSTYKFKGIEYVNYSDTIIEDGISIITRVKQQENGKFTYEFYNIRGDLLLTLNNFNTPNRTLNFWKYKDKNNAILHIATNVGGVEYYLTVDR